MKKGNESDKSHLNTETPIYGHGNTPRKRRRKVMDSPQYVNRQNQRLENITTEEES